MEEFNINDVREAFNYAIKHPYSTFETWLNYWRNNLSESDIELYHDIKYCEIKVDVAYTPCKFYLFSGFHGIILDSLIKRIAGDREYYCLAGDGYHDMEMITFDADLLRCDYLSPHPIYNKIGLMQKEYPEIGLTIQYFGLPDNTCDDLDLIYESYNYYKTRKDNKEYIFNFGSTYVYMKSLCDLKFESVLNLFNK